MLEMPVIDLGLQRGALVEQGAVARGEIGEQGGKAGPELLGVQAARTGVSLPAARPH
jgi:hypothetical protein